VDDNTVRTIFHLMIDRYYVAAERFMKEHLTSLEMQDLPDELEAYKRWLVATVERLIATAGQEGEA
jgi:hypothetical protein